jgi:hypothetical protein
MLSEINPHRHVNPPTIGPIVLLLLCTTRYPYSEKEENREHVHYYIIVVVVVVVVGKVLHQQGEILACPFGFLLHE